MCGGMLLHRTDFMMKGEAPTQQGTRSGVEHPRCSVVMPVYNMDEGFFREAIESIIRQTYKDFEFIIVDDHSDADMQGVIRSYADARIRTIRMERQSGAAAARNRALDVARGEYIAFMDADDVALPERLAKQVEYLDAHPEVSCLGTEYKIFNGKGYRAASGVPHDHDGIVSYLVFCGCAFCQSSVMLRRAVLESSAPPLRYRAELEAAHDCALWFDLIGRARFAILPEALVHYRVHPQSISGRASELQVRKMAEAQARLLERYSGCTLRAPENWLRLLRGATLARGEYAELSRCLLQAAAALRAQHGCRAAAVEFALRRRVRKAFCRTRGLRGQWELLRLPLRKQVRLPLWWCGFCFIVKGIFGH